MSVMVDIDPQRYRQVLGHLPTGVTVIASHGAEGPVGLAANSVTSLSLDPPMILFCPAKSSSTWPKLRESGAFCINILAGHHEELTRQFARKGEHDRFAGVEYERRPMGPALTDAVAWIECRLNAEHDAGDHTIVVADIVAIEAASEAAAAEGVDEREPLVFFRGRYGSFRSALEA